jgi:hypothetical protein
MTVVRFTQQQMENWREADRKTPRTRKLLDLTKAPERANWAGSAARLTNWAES